MKQKIYCVMFALIACAAMFSACKKALDSPIPSRPNGIRDTAGDIRTILNASPYTLFNQAFTRAGIDSPYSFYTVLAPSDSAMTAAGLTAAVINSLTLDSLYNIISYHLVYGSYSDTVLGNDTLTLELPSLLVNTSEGLLYGSYTQTSFQQDLFLSYNNVLYEGGQAVGDGMPLRASNGWIYPVNRVLTPPSETIWGYIVSRPELSMYVAAERLVDSMNNVTYFNYGSIDSNLFTTITYLPGEYQVQQPQEMPTVLAPTNDAFAKAGFNTVQDIRNYVIATQPYMSYPQFVPNYDGMDSVLKLHYLYNQGQDPVFYQDMLYSPRMNDGWLNADSWYTGAYLSYAQLAPPGIPPFYPKYTNQSGTVSIQWSDNPSIPAASLSLTGGFLGLNGVVYEIDQLFYPHN